MYGYRGPGATTIDRQSKLCCAAGIMIVRADRSPPHPDGSLPNMWLPYRGDVRWGRVASPRSHNALFGRLATMQPSDSRRSPSGSRTKEAHEEANHRGSPGCDSGKLSSRKAEGRGRRVARRACGCRSHCREARRPRKGGKTRGRAPLKAGTPAPCAKADFSPVRRLTVWLWREAARHARRSAQAASRSPDTCGSSPPPPP